MILIDEYHNLYHDIETHIDDIKQYESTRVLMNIEKIVIMTKIPDYVCMIAFGATELSTIEGSIFSSPLTKCATKN